MAKLCTESDVTVLEQVLVFQELLIICDFQTQQSVEFTQNGAKKKSNSKINSSL